MSTAGVEADGTKRRAAVTGASSGIGAAFARRLAVSGFDVVLVARREQRLRALADALAEEHGVGTEVVVADLAVAADVDRLATQLAGDPHLDVVVNNAGTAGFTPFVKQSAEEVEGLLALHVRTPVTLTSAVVPAMMSRAHGAIINISSLLAFSESMPPDPLPFRSVYLGCKAFLVAFTQGLHHELCGTGVQVQVCCPGVVATEFHQAAGIDRSASPFRAMSADDVVTASLAGLRWGEPLCLPGLADPSLIDSYHKTHRDLFFTANHDRLATRYRDRT